MKLKSGVLYYFWNNAEGKVDFLTVTSIKGDEVTFSMRKGKRGKSKLKDVEGLLYENKWDIPEYRKTQQEAETEPDEKPEDGFDNLVGFEHSAPFSEYDYYPSIYYYQGSDDTLIHGSVFDAEEAYDLGQ